MRKCNYLLIFILSVFIFSCETAPPVKPVAWMRTLSSSVDIEAGGVISVNVTGVTNPLSGDERLVAKRLEEYVSDLLSRRGFIISSSNYNYRCNISYKTNMGSRIAVNTQEQTSYISSMFDDTVLGVTGVTLFNTVLGTVIANPNVNIKVNETAAFLHNISVNLLDRNNNLIWSGDTAWETSDLDILQNSYMVFKKLFISLPKNNNVPAKVPRIKQDRIIDYFTLFCKGKWFTSMALPYQIRFDPLIEIRQDASNTRDSKLYTELQIVNELPNTISEGQNLAAYVDLILMSEMALPAGTIEEWKKNPLSEDIWKEVQLGGRYIIGNNNAVNNIILNLKLISGGNGYSVNKCRVADDNEYDIFMQKMLQWQNIAKEYITHYNNFYE